MIHRRFYAFLFLLCLPVAAAAQGAAGTERSVRTATVTAITAPIVLDGVLSEDMWQSPSIGDLVQRQPRPGIAPTERTEVVLLRDNSHLYVGVRAFDAQADRVLGSQMARDGGLGADDRIEILIDTFRDQRNAFYFATNPAGTLLDGLAFGNGELNNEWDAIWDVRTRRSPEGWTAEFAIPFKSLTFPEDGQEWGFNVSRTIQRKLEENRWTGARLETRFLQVSEAGTISGISGATQGLGLDFRPFLAGNQLHVGRTGANTVKGKPGFDLFYSLTPSLKLSATVNTDFADTEVDARTINLTRFSVLFPEKRSFFLEDVGVFSFASTGPDPAAGIAGTGAEVFPFFSRQIGLLNGQEVPLQAGLKFTGKIGRTEIGVFDVRTGALDAGGRRLVDERNAFVGRIRRNFFQQSYAGLIVTSGNPALPISSQTVGGDLRLATSRLFGRSRNLIVNAYGLRSINENRDGRDYSWGASAIYPNDKISTQFAIREIQENFAPALGFVQRDNVRMMRAAFSYNPRPRNFLRIQQMFHDFYYTQFTNLTTGRLESADFYMTVLDWHLNTGDSWHGMLDVNRVFERLFEPFTISPGVILPVGDYSYTRFKTNFFSTANRRNVSGNLTFTWGDYWSGTAEQLNAGVAFKIPPRFNFSLNTNQTFARLPQGHFVARVYTSTVNYTHSPRLAWSNLMQFDNRSRNLGWQSRLRWTLHPGADVFVVFNQGWIQETGDSLRFRAMDRKTAAKVQYAVLF